MILELLELELVVVILEDEVVVKLEELLDEVVVIDELELELDELDVVVIDDELELEELVVVILELLELLELEVVVIEVEVDVPSL